ncbi:hypothetical protein [Mesonia maritima]|uniref:Lipoprotein n=1 Tax=Mesonia maritima TaxID=1793873 RepID=A0ABU1K1G5_9FLAO|nr:hypothetical protein [Mesonia maritima]MDR6299449.1 hypothetical protein [Mesonia maritima]
MKKSIKNLSVLFSILLLAVFATSCNNDDDSSSDDDTPIAESELNGSITEDMTLDAGTNYQLTGIFSVEPGAKLTIPAGTQITTETGTDVYMVVQQGAKIDIQGTASSPVRMAPEGSGTWGGLVILGEGKTTAGVDATAEVGGLIYGGNNNADNSGSIKYLVIEQSGAQINSESQYNGLTLYSVGSETVIENIAILNGQDDGIEFFGGAANATNVYVENLEDDAIDWTEGWEGTLTNTYVLHSIEGFSTAIEADGTNNNPTITNFTAVSQTGGTALQFKAQSGATITGLSLNGYETALDMANDGPLTNISINGEVADLDATYTGPSTVSLSDFDWIANANIDNILNGEITSDVELDPSITYSLPGILSVEEGASLTIPAGTKIVTGTGTDVYIAVQKGGQIFIEGTASNPVEMGPDSNGVWGGLLLLGEGVTTAGVNATAEVGGLIYGGDNNDDSSGSIEYLIIKKSGAQINSESQYNGLTLYAVGANTTIENIAIIDGQDDGIEFFGGAANATNVYVENLEDDAIDWTEGWEGTLTNTYVLHTEPGFSTALEADGTNNNPKIVNFTAISQEGGTALQFKAQSGATITGLSLSGYETSIDMANDGPLSNISIDGNIADPTLTYEVAATVDVNDFSWATN